MIIVFLLSCLDCKLPCLLALFHCFQIGRSKSLRAGHLLGLENFLKTFLLYSSKMCLFCEFVKGEKTINKDGSNFIILNETEHTISFLSTDYPAHEDGHMLIIPKEHYESLEAVPNDILHDLIEHVSLAAKVTKKNHEACNILLNNGHVAGQVVMHVHFHVVPRDKEDNIAIEVWKERYMPKGEYDNLCTRLKSDFESVNRS